MEEFYKQCPEDIQDITDIYYDYKDLFHLSRGIVIRERFSQGEDSSIRKLAYFPSFSILDKNPREFMDKHSRLKVIMEIKFTRYTFIQGIVEVIKLGEKYFYQIKDRKCKGQGFKLGAFLSLQEYEPSIKEKFPVKPFSLVDEDPLAHNFLSYDRSAKEWIERFANGKFNYLLEKFSHMNGWELSTINLEDCEDEEFLICVRAFSHYKYYKLAKILRKSPKILKRKDYILVSLHSAEELIEYGNIPPDIASIWKKRAGQIW